jgi:hypothetical protein
MLLGSRIRSQRGVASVIFLQLIGEAHGVELEASGAGYTHCGASLRGGRTRREHRRDVSRGGECPGADQAYSGRAQVKKTGATYTIVWQIGEGGHVGTGILTSDVLSVFFQPLDRRGAPGDRQLRVIEGKITGGTWTVLGGNVVGDERWVPDRGI